jgi:hypothetical protein
MLTFAQLESKVREIIAADPDHVYRMPESSVQINGCLSVTCFYSTASHKDAIEACVFGRALSALGVTDEQLLPMEGVRIGEVWRSDHIAGERLTDKQAYWARVIQNQQDQGKPWGFALRHADEQAGNLV